MDNPILVREDEPSSIIAHILSSQRYREYLDKLRVSQRTESFMPDDSRSFDDKASWDIVDVDDKGVDKEIGGHFEIGALSSPALHASSDKRLHRVRRRLDQILVQHLLRRAI